MSPIEMTMAVINRVLEVDFEDWDYEVVGPMNLIWTRQPGWWAELEYRSAQTGIPATDHEAFLEQYRSASSAYKIDIWVNSEGQVLSAMSNGGVSVVQVKRGEWEPLFELPAPEIEEASSYFGVLIQ